MLAASVTTAFAAGGNLIQNGGFEDSTLIWANSGNFGSIGSDGRTAVWTGGQICKANATLQPPSGFIVGTYCGYLWSASTLNQTFVFPVDGTCRVAFKAALRTGTTPNHPIKVILTRTDTGVAVTNEFTVSSKVAAGDAYQHDFEHVSAGPYKLSIAGTNSGDASFYESVSVTVVSGSDPFAGIYFVQDCGTLVSLKVRSFGGSNDEAISVDYALSENGTTWSEWTSVSSSLAKGSSASAVIEQLELETAYRLKLRLTAGGSEQIVVIPFTTTNELLRNRGFEENTITSAASKGVSDAVPWQGNGSVARKDYSTLAPKAAIASGGFHAFCWCNQNVNQSVYVPVTGTYRLKFKYVIRNGNTQHVFDLALISSDATNTIDTVTNTKTAATTYSKDFRVESTGTMTFRFRGTEPSSTRDGTSFMDDFSLTLVEKDSVNPSAVTAVDTTSVQYDQVTINNELLATGGSAVDVYFAYGPTEGTLGAYELLRSGVTETGAFSHTISNLTIATGYQYTYRYVNTLGGEATVSGTFTTRKDIFRNGSFENGSSISGSSGYGDIGGTAQTEAWTKGSMAASTCSTFYPSAQFAVGNFFGYIWWDGSLE